MGTMNGRTAGFLFLGICVVPATLLLTSAITPLVSGCVFAGALILLGWLSRGFRHT
jgi:hypothetical protein